MREPEIRARWSQRILEWLAEDGAARGTAALRQLDSESRRIIDQASALSWIPFGSHHALMRSVQSAFSHQPFFETYADISEAALTMPMFEGLIRPLVRLLDRKAMVRGFPNGWAATIRGAGQPEVVQGDHDRVNTFVHFRAVPEGLAHDRVFRESVRGLLMALMRRGEIPGVVSADYGAASDGLLSYTMRSHQPAPAAF